MNIVAIIQARMTSSRLPGKVMMPIGDKPLIGMMIDRVKRSKYISRIVVATPADDKCDDLHAFCRGKGVDVFVGDEHDVLSRFAGAAREYGADVVIRLCSDCPFSDPDVIDEVIETFLSGGYDYVNNVGKRSYPDGLDAEIFKAEALYRADREATDPKHREHVTTYIDGRVAGLDKGDFVCGSVDHTPSYGHLMWSVNTQEHLDHLRDLYARVSDKENFSWKDVLKAEEELNDAKNI